MKSPLADYYDRLSWLRSLMTDPGGSFYTKPMSQTAYLKYYLKQFNRTKAFLDYIGNPQDKYPVVHVAGTSGKGSVVTMLGSMLKIAGLRVGVHTSPYLQLPNEKLVADGRMISHAELVELIDEFKTLHQDYVKQGNEPLHYQEAWAVLVYMYFAKKQVDWAVVETSLGGRYDPTNVVSSKLAIITNISPEHMPQLGTSLTDIAKHKAGIIKPGQPVITAECNPKINEVFLEEAIKKSAALYRLSRNFGYRITSTDYDIGMTVDIRTPFSHYDAIRITQPGTYNTANACCAVMAADLLAHRYGLPINEGHIRIALGTWSLEGRMETVQYSPQVMLDGAHNPQKMGALMETIKAVYQNRDITVVLGMLSFKDADDMIGQVLTVANRIIVTQPRVTGKPSLSADVIADRIKRLAPSLPVIACASVKDAIDSALIGTKEDELVLITGSVYLIGEARERWLPSDEMLAGC